MAFLSSVIQRKGGIAMGVALSCAAAAAAWSGLLDPINNFGLDANFRWFNDLQADPRIVMIDIDDSSIRAVGEYPWPRRFYAELVRELNKLGSERVLLDLMLSEPSDTQTPHSAFTADIDAFFLDSPDLEKPLREEDDVARFISHATLPMSGHIVDIGEESRIRQMSLANPAREYFDQAPEPSLEGFLASALRPERRNVESPDRTEMIRQFRAELARRAWREKAIALPKSCSSLPAVAAPAFPLEEYVQHGPGIGFVAYERRKQDGVVRTIPLAVRVEDRIVYQLGLGTVFNAQRVECKENLLHLITPSEERFIPLDDKSLTLINWVKPSGSDITTDGFVRIPAARVLQLAEKRQALLANGQLKQVRLNELVQVRNKETPAEYQKYVDLIRRRWEIIRRIASVQIQGKYSGERAELGDQIKRTEEDALVWLERVYAEWRKTDPQDESERAQFAQVEHLHNWFFVETSQMESAARGVRLAGEVKELATELSPKINGKHCLVGYTATGVADLITTPVHDLAPGVLAHANVINMVLQNRFIKALSGGQNAALVLLAGMVATLVACGPSWRFSLLGIALTVLGCAIGGVLLFSAAGIHAAAMPAAAGSAAVWSGITLYRQATEERARRRLQLALTQYTSPAIAAAISQQVSHKALAPQAARVSCFFSDLEGFTRLSERLGPARTKEVLNPYLELTTEILIEHGALVNKFVGDGVFAFFNAPIRPCQDHARQACAAARDLVTRCPFVGDPSAGDRHRVRVGISTGDVFVGDYGSQAKLDYTSIGDTVNLGSRLEQLNKVFGTTILVDDATRELSGGAFEFRCLGRVRIHGRRAAATIHEMILAPPDQERRSDFHEAWGRMILHYQGCQWDLCHSHLQTCMQMRPGDKAAGLYGAALQRLRSGEPKSDWDGTLDLEPLTAQDLLLDAQ